MLHTRCSFQSQSWFYNVFPIGIPLYQGNTLSLSNCFTLIVDSLTTCKMLLRLGILAGTSDLKTQTYTTETLNYFLIVFVILPPSRPEKRSWFHFDKSNWSLTCLDKSCQTQWSSPTLSLIHQEVRYCHQCYYLKKQV